MKTTMIQWMLAASVVIVLTACTKDSSSDLNGWTVTNDSSSDNSTSGSSTVSGSADASASATLNLSELTALTVDKSSAEPTSVATAYYPEAEDNLDDTSNSEFTSGSVAQITIDMANQQSGTVDGVTITNTNGTIVCNHGSNKVCYTVSGTTSCGSLTIVGEKKCEVVLNGVDITSPDSAALNILSKKRAFVCLADGTTNTLRDTQSSNDHKGALYAKGKLLFSGTGSLSVYGRHNNAIHSADYIIFNKGVNVYANSTTNHGIKANDGIYINGGILNVEVSAGGAKAINCESDVIVNGGRTIAIATGNRTYDSTEGDYKSAKGIKADGNISINGGEVAVRVTGTQAEGIESEGTMDITGGTVSVYAKQDDAMNAAGNMTISGGTVIGYSAGNDGMDANGNFYIKGGIVYAIGASQPEVGIDANTEGGYKLYVQGGTLIAVGGLESGAQLSQACYQAASWSRNTWYNLTTGGTTVAFQTPASGGSGLVVSTASTPTLTCNGSTVSLSSYSGGMGGMGPGGWR